MAALTRDRIFAASDLGREVVECPEWGGSVTVRGMTLGERDRFIAAVRNDVQHLPALLVALAAIDAKTGERLFSDEDVQALAEKSPVAIERVGAVALRLSGLNPEGDPVKN